MDTTGVMVTIEQMLRYHHGGLIEKYDNVVIWESTKRWTGTGMGTRRGREVIGVAAVVDYVRRVPRNDRKNKARQHECSGTAINVRPIVQQQWDKNV